MCIENPDISQRLAFGLPFFWVFWAWTILRWIIRIKFILLSSGLVSFDQGRCVSLWLKTIGWLVNLFCFFGQFRFIDIIAWKFGITLGGLLFIFTSNDYQVSIFVGNARMTRSWRRNGPICSLYPRECCMKLWYVIHTLFLIYLELIKVVEEAFFIGPLAPKNVDVVVDYATGVTVATLRHISWLRAFNPAKELWFVRIVSIRQSLWRSEILCQIIKSQKRSTIGLFWFKLKTYKTFSWSIFLIIDIPLDLALHLIKVIVKPN